VEVDVGWGVPENEATPNSWFIENGKSENIMDDNWGI